MRRHKGILAEGQHRTALASRYVVQRSTEGDCISEAVDWLPLTKLNEGNDSLPCELQNAGH